MSICGFLKKKLSKRPAPVTTASIAGKSGRKSQTDNQTSNLTTNLLLLDALTDTDVTTRSKNLNDTTHSRVRNPDYDEDHFERYSNITSRTPSSNDSYSGSGGGFSGGGSDSSSSSSSDGGGGGSSD